MPFLFVLYNYEFSLHTQIKGLFDLPCVWLTNLLNLEGVAGGAASGKTTVCDMIIHQLHDQRVVLVNQVLILYGNFIYWR